MLMRPLAGFLAGQFLDIGTRARVFGGRMGGQAARPLRAETRRTVMTERSRVTPAFARR